MRWKSVAIEETTETSCSKSRVMQQELKCHCTRRKLLDKPDLYYDPQGLNLVVLRRTNLASMDKWQHIAPNCIAGWRVWIRHSTRVPKEKSPFYGGQPRRITRPNTSSALSIGNLINLSSAIRNLKKLQLDGGIDEMAENNLEARRSLNVRFTWPFSIFTISNKCDSRQL